MIFRHISSKLGPADVKLQVDGSQCLSGPAEAAGERIRQKLHLGRVKIRYQANLGYYSEIKHMRRLEVSYSKTSNHIDDAWPYNIDQTQGVK